MSASTFLDGRVTLEAGDCREVLQGFESNSFDSVVTDPPYALVSIVKRFGKPGAAPGRHGKDGLYARASAGFMGKQWDTGETAFAAEFWGEVWRVLKPGGHVAAFSGTRTYHRLAIAIEDAGRWIVRADGKREWEHLGFEIRDQLAWVYGSGFPKSHNLDGDWEGWGTALKPAWEPIVLARKPLAGTVAANVLEHGTGALNIDGCRVPTNETISATQNVALGSSGSGVYGGASVPGVYEQKVGGRWPANIIHDGGNEVEAAFPAAPGQQRALVGGEDSEAQIYGKFGPKLAHAPRKDSGSAARFFYSAKADANDRVGSKHPTVKPLDLMQWLCRLITPPGGLVLDPFAGTGSTGEAAWREGFRAVLIEREAEYQADIAKRMELCLAGPATRRAAIGAAKAERVSDPLPLFAAE